jgi:hypothetical protein
MGSVVSTPEELETLLEDAFVVRDALAVAELFEPDALLAAVGATHPARGLPAIAELAAGLWERDRIHIAQPRTILQTRSAALVVAPRAISALHRGPDGWRYAISLLSPIDRPDDERRQT